MSKRRGFPKLPKKRPFPVSLKSKSDIGYTVEDRVMRYFRRRLEKDGTPHVIVQTRASRVYDIIIILPDRIRLIEVKKGKRNMSFWPFKEQYILAYDVNAVLIVVLKDEKKFFMRMYDMLTSPEEVLNKHKPVTPKYVEFHLEELEKELKTDPRKEQES